MSRPNKQGVDYFPLDVHLDDKFKFIEIKYKLEGFAILIKLLQKIYSYGYWYKWTDDEALLFADEIRADYQLVVSVVNEALERGVFNKDLHTKHNILTSKGIQKRYKEIVRRRKDVEVTEDYLLIDDMMTTFGQQINGKVTTLSKQSDGKSTQSKVKESKVNKSKENNKINYAEFVSMEEKEYQKLVEQFGEGGTKDRIDNLNLYKGSKGIKYQSDYMTILAWERKSKKQEPEHKEIVLTEIQQLEKRFNELDGIMSLGVGYYERINCTEEYYAAEREYEEIERKLHSYKN